MARPRRRQRGVKGTPWYRKYNDTWYIDFNDKQVAIKDPDGNNVKGADNRQQAEQCWVLMQAEMLATAKGDENTVRLVFKLYLDHVQENHPEAYPAYKRTLVGFADSLPAYEYLVRDLTAFHVDGWLRKNPGWATRPRRAMSPSSWPP